MKSLENEKLLLIKLIEKSFDKDYLESLLVVYVLPEVDEENNLEITICERGAFYAC